MVERICELIKQKGMSINSVEKQLKFGNGAIKRFDKHSPSIDKIISLSDFLNVSIDYLVFGKETEHAEKINLIDSNETTMLNLFRMLSEKEQDRIIGRLENMVENSQEAKKQDAV